VAVFLRRGRIRTRTAAQSSCSEILLATLFGSAPIRPQANSAFNDERRSGLLVLGVPAAHVPKDRTGGDRDLWFSRQAWTQLGDSTELETRSSLVLVMGRLRLCRNRESGHAQIKTSRNGWPKSHPPTNKERRRHLWSPISISGCNRPEPMDWLLLAIVLLVVRSHPPRGQVCCYRRWCAREEMRCGCLGRCRWAPDSHT